VRYEIGQVNRLGNRSSNQDRFVAVESEEGVLLVLGDGMGGQACGEVAAQLLVDTAHKLYTDAVRPIDRPKEFLNTIIQAAHLAIIDFGLRQEPPITPGTTGVLCLVQQGQAVWAHVGDSRLYLFQGGLPIYRTTDHSYVEQLYQQGAISRWEQENHPQRNQITQCLGCRAAAPEVSFSNVVNLRQNDILMLCSDGLWGPLDDAQMGAMLNDRDSLDDLLNSMAEKSEHLSYPRSDNISGLALRFISNEPPEQAESKEEDKSSPEAADELQNAIAKIEAVIKEYEKEIEQ